MTLNRTGYRIGLAASAILLISILYFGASIPSRLRANLRNDPLAGFPKVFLWVWERPENLKFLNPDEAGVAILAKTLTIGGRLITSRPRMQPVNLRPDTVAMAVVRIETEHLDPSQELLDKTVEEILKTAESTPSKGIQVDFDALESERPFYRKLLEKLDEQLPSNRPLSITALASWCLYDDWISNLPVDEAVPMLFRLGKDETNVKRYLRTGHEFRPAISQSSVGVSMDELPADLPRGRRIYIFNPSPWTEESVRQALNFARSMQ
jgi:hypothetical protein